MLTVSRADARHDGHWDKASDIAARLNAAGYSVSMRTVQRDLKELSSLFPIELNDKNPRDFGWRWPKATYLNIPGMGIPEALAMCLVQAHTRQLLPASMLDGLQGLFSVAHHKLDQAQQNNANPTRDWLSKVRVVPPAQPLLPPVVIESVQSNVYQAVLENKQVSATYRSIDSEQSKAYVLHPLGLIMRGAVTYLVASAWDYADVRLYALHRFGKVEMLEATINTPEGFDLDQALAGGLAEFANQGEPICLELRCTASAAAYLAETPLAADQTIEIDDDKDGWVRVTATVNDTWQLHWWILGQGAEVEVRAPRYLRSRIKNNIQNTAKKYR